MPTTIIAEGTGHIAVENTPDIGIVRAAAAGNEIEDMGH